MATNPLVALTTLANLKLFLSESTGDDFITDTGYDSKLEGIIDAVGQWFNTYTGRNLIEKAHTSYFDGGGTATILLPHFPIISAASEIEIYIDPDRVYGADTKVAEANLMIYAEDGIVRIEDEVFALGAQAIKVVYTAGYELAADDGVLLPEDLKYAALLTSGMLWKTEKEKLYKMGSITIAGGSVTYNVDEAMLPAVRDILDLYVAEGRAGIIW